MAAEMVYLIQFTAAILIAIGIGVIIARRNVFFALMGIELVLNGVNLSFVGFSRTLPDASGLIGQIVPLFVIALAAAEACIGLAMVIVLVRSRELLDSDGFVLVKE